MMYKIEQLLNPTINEQYLIFDNIKDFFNE